VVVTNAKQAINAVGLKESFLDNFIFNNINVTSATAGEISFANNWKITNSTVVAADGKQPAIKNSNNIKMQ
jgi:hypothetical protein